MNYLVTLATDGTNGTRDRRKTLLQLKEQCGKYYINTETFVWDYQKLQESHIFQAYSHIMDMDHMLGFWLWKPYIILDALHQLQENDVVCYMDSDLALNSDPKQYINEALFDDVKLLGLPWINWKFTTSICFNKMGMDNKEYWDINQMWGAAMFFRVCSYSMKLVTDWLVYCTNEEILYSKDKEKHRWDQSVLTNLAFREGIDFSDTKDHGIFGHPSFPTYAGGYK